MKRKIAVIGAGAAGMMAALTAAQQGAEVTLLEKQPRAARKLLATGNGRCNLTNLQARPERYLSREGEAADFARPALEVFPPEKTLEWFTGWGLLPLPQSGGRVYPASDTANSVTDILRYALAENGVKLLTGIGVKKLRRHKNGWVCETTSAGEPTDEMQKEISSLASTVFDRVIIACGGAASEKLGGTSDGYELLKSLGHHRTPLAPSLAPIPVDSPYPRALKGVRAEAKLQLLFPGEKNKAQRILQESRGELQFAEGFLSGPAAFDLARSAALAPPESRISADFFPDGSEQELFNLLVHRRQSLPSPEAGELFVGMLPNKLGRMVVKYAEISFGESIGSLTEENLHKAAAGAKHFLFPVKGTASLTLAQVTAGGIRTAEFSPKTLESRLAPGIYACGEVLDIDGPCGGYNLQWAWSSGRLAGEAACRA